MKMSSWPSILAQSALVETLHGDQTVVKKKLRVFYIGFGVVFAWTLFPQYISEYHPRIALARNCVHLLTIIVPLTIGISVFCLGMQKNLLITRIFGGASSNEGLGFLSLCLDWQNITSSCMW
jgi:hypothetical protein